MGQALRALTHRPSKEDLSTLAEPRLVSPNVSKVPKVPQEPEASEGLEAGLEAGLETGFKAGLDRVMVQP
jgi:hypothetical protein